MSTACPGGVPASAWFDWWDANLDPEEARRLEEHLFACDVCGDEAYAARRLIDGIREAVRHRPPGGAAGRAQVEALERDRRVVRRYTVPWNGAVHCTVGADDDLVVLELQGNFRGVERVDSVLAHEGRPLERMEDVPVVRGSAVLWGKTGEELRRYADVTFEVILLAVEQAGEREIARYTLDHEAFAG